MKNLVKAVILAAVLTQFSWAEVKFSNYVSALVMESVTTNETDITLSNVTGFPTLSTTNDYFYMVLMRVTDYAKEIVKVTAYDTTNKVITVTRAQDSTTAKTFAQNDRCELWFIGADFEDLRTEANAYTDIYYTTNRSDIDRNYWLILTNITNISANDADISNLVTRLSGVVTTGALDTAAFNTAIFEYDASTNITVKTNSLALNKIVNLTSMKVIGNVTNSTSAPTEVPVLDEDAMDSDSATALATQQSIKAYVDTTSVAEAKNYAMQYSGTTVFTGSMPTSYTDLDLSGTVGTNRCFVHMQVSPDASCNLFLRPNGETKDIGLGASGNPTGTSGGTTTASTTATVFLSLITDSSGIVEWKSSGAGSGGTVVKILSYQVLQ